MAVSIVTYAALYEGAYYSHAPEAAVAGLADFMANKDLLGLTPAIAERFAIVSGSLPRNLRQQIGDMDLFTAATALTYDLTLVTRNLKDFEHISGLRIYRTSN